MESSTARQTPRWASEKLCGCTIPDPNFPKPAISFSNIIPEAPVQSHYDPLVPPLTVDNLAPFKTWKKLGNDRYSDCVPVTWANMRRLVTSRLTGREAYPSMSQVMELYKNFNPEIGQDDGAGIQDTLKYLVDHGGPDGVQAIAFAKVKVTQSLEDIRKALAIFGSIWIGISVYDPNRDEFDYRQPWTAQNEKGWEGHSALVGGYTSDGNLRIVTWGGVAQLTNECALSQIYEAWVVVWPEHLSSRRFMRGVDLTQLSREYEILTNSTPLCLRSSLNRVHYILPEDKKFSEKFLVMHTIIPDIETVSQASFNGQPVPAITPISMQRSLTGCLLVDNDDLYHIRTKDTASDFVEVTRALGPSYYDLEYDQPMVTLFKSRPDQQGVFTIDNGDLYFVQTRKTSSGFIEVYFAPQEQLFQNIERYVTAFPVLQDSADVYKCTVRGGDLYLLEVNSGQNTSALQIRCARGNANYSKASTTSQVIKAPFNPVSETLHIASNGDLYVIQSAATTSGKIEIKIAQAQNNYASFLHFTTSIEIKQSANVAQETIETNWMV